MEEVATQLEVLQSTLKKASTEQQYAFKFCIKLEGTASKMLHMSRIAYGDVILPLVPCSVNTLKTNIVPDPCKNI